MALQVITKTFSGSNPYELDNTSTPSGVTSLYEALVAAGTSTEYVDSSYAVHEKGDVSATVVYKDSGSQSMAVKEFKESRSLFGQSAYVFQAFGTYGLPAYGSGVNLLTEINEWLEAQEVAAEDSGITIRDVHFQIDVANQHRVLVVYDPDNAPSNVHYRAKLYSQTRYNVGTTDGPEQLFSDDLAYIQNTDSKTLNKLWVDFRMGQSDGDRNIFVLYDHSSV